MQSRKTFTVVRAAVPGLAFAALAAFAANPAAQATPVFQYGYDYTTGTVADYDSGVINDDSGAGNHGRASTVPGATSGGEYTPDIPDAALLQNTTGIGSVDLTNGRHLTSNTNIFNRADIIAGGGLTVQVWIKPSANSGTDNWSGDIHELILSDGGYYSIGVGDPAGALGTEGDGVVRVGPYLSSSMVGSGAEVPEDEWSHLAIVFSNPSENGANTNAALDFYVNGTLVETIASVDFTTAGQANPDPPRGIGLGFHPFADATGNVFYDAMAFQGKVFEPVVTLAALDPSEFTVIPEPGTAALTLAGLAMFATRRRKA